MVLANITSFVETSTRFWTQAPFLHPSVLTMNCSATHGSPFRCIDHTTIASASRRSEPTILSLCMSNRTRMYFDCERRTMSGDANKSNPSTRSDSVRSSTDHWGCFPFCRLRRTSVRQRSFILWLANINKDSSRTCWMAWGLFRRASLRF